jgi:hypothetical protein
MKRICNLLLDPGGQPDGGPPSYLHVERDGPESTNRRPIMKLMSIRRADRRTEAYNGGSDQ